MNMAWNNSLISSFKMDLLDLGSVNERGLILTAHWQNLSKFG